MVNPQEDTVRRAFLDEIRENPDDDTPRLVFADWLAEHGQEERGEFIRAQVRGDELREFQLLFEPGSTGSEALPRLPGIRWGDPKRGFVEQVTAETAKAFLTNAEAILAAAPVFRLKLRVVDDSFAALCNSPLLAGLHELDLGNQTGLTPNDLFWLRDSNHAINIRSLLIHQNELGDQGLERLAYSDLTNLRAFYVSGIGAGDNGVQRFFSGRLYRHRLELLDLRDNHLTADGTAHLARWEGLRTLWLVNNPIGDAGALVFANAPRSSLRQLDLSHCGITGAGAIALAESPLADQLEEIALRGNTFRPETWAMLRAKFKEKLRE